MTNPVTVSESLCRRSLVVQTKCCIISGLAGLLVKRYWAGGVTQVCWYKARCSETRLEIKCDQELLFNVLLPLIKCCDRVGNVHIPWVMCIFLG